MLQAILGNREFIVRNYIDDTVKLVKSILLVNSMEAKTYNTALSETYPALNLNISDKRTWRYYLHLSGALHPLDDRVWIKSIDNLTLIELNRINLLVYKKTRTELLKFGKYYKELVGAYPSYELYIKAVLCDPLYTLDEIIKLEDLSVVCFNKDYIEDTELDVMEELQQRLLNYKVTWALPYYAKSDTLFLASQMAITTLFVLTSLLAIRLRNAKTINAHSFHIKNYLSSYHYLDEYYNYLSKEQRVFLYRNLLYINNHVGTNETFALLIQKLFTERGIPISTYDYYTTDTLDENRNPTYVFKKKYYNADQDYYNYTLGDIVGKENSIVFKNKTHWDIAEPSVNTGLTHTLYNYLSTKDLETSLYDYTDNVRWKLMQTILDYTAYTCKNHTANFSIQLTNASNTVNYSINAPDAFKLMCLLLYYYQGQAIESFPSYQIRRVRKATLPTVDELLSKVYRSKNYYRPEVTKILFAAIEYPASIVSSYQLYDFVNKQYLLDMGTWLYLTNTSDMDDEGQMNAIIEEMYRSDIYDLGDESVEVFISRLSMQELNDYTQSELLTLFNSLLNSIFDNRYNELFSIQFVQKALIGVFNKFKSYTLQITDEYTANNISMSGNKSCRFAVGTDIIEKIYFLDSYIANIETTTQSTSLQDYTTEFTYDSDYAYSANLTVSFSSRVLKGSDIDIVIPLRMDSSVLSTNHPTYTVIPSEQEDLFFLASALA